MMLGKTFKEYILSWKNVPSKINIANGLIPFIFGLAVLIVNGIQKGNLGEALKLVLIMVPMFFVIMSVMKHPLRPGKMFYLCPMDSEERISTARRAYYFRVALHFLVMAAFSLTYYFVFDVSAATLIILLLNGFILAAIPSYEENRYIQTIILLPIIIFATIVQAALAPYAQFEKEDYVATIICAAVLLLVEMPLFIVAMRKAKNDIQGTAYYEEEIKNGKN